MFVINENIIGDEASFHSRYYKNVKTRPSSLQANSK